MKVYILFGFAEGHWHAKNLVAELNKKGHELVKDPLDAEIVIAHSGGCYLIPKHEHFKEIIMVGLPYLPGSEMFKAMANKVSLEKKDAYFFNKMLHAAYYLLTKPVYFYRMFRGWRQYTLPLHESKKTLVVNHKDTFAHMHKLSDLADKHDWDLHFLNGQHDDLWTNPGPYISLIK